MQETTRDSLDEVRRIARRLRPGVLEELGLVSALTSLAAEFAAHTGLRVRPPLRRRTCPRWTTRPSWCIYRVAQEGLTNIARHAEATPRRSDPAPARRAGVELRVRDDGRGLGGAPEGAGIRGMRERALLVGATLDHRPAARRAAPR